MLVQHKEPHKLDSRVRHEDQYEIEQLNKVCRRAKKSRPVRIDSMDIGKKA